MNSFKEQMIANYERGYCSYSDAYAFTRDQALDAADMARKAARETPPLLQEVLDLADDYSAEMKRLTEERARSAEGVAPQVEGDKSREEHP